MRMLRMEAVQKEVLDDVERTLRTEFFTNLARSNRRDAHELIAEIFNSLDRSTETKFLNALEERNRDSAERVKSLMFTFEDLAKLDNNSMQTVLRNAEKEKIPVALKGASETMKDVFFGNMSERAAKLLKEEIASMGPVRLKDVEEAQSYIVSVAKDLAARGEVIIAEGNSDDELVY
jgi:flagellar motor switch protein FliG